MMQMGARRMETETLSPASARETLVGHHSGNSNPQKDQRLAWSPSQLLTALIRAPRLEPMIDMLVHVVSRLIPYTGTKGPGSVAVPPLPKFLTGLICSAKLKASTLLLALVYLHRLKKRLPPSAQGMACTPHRTVLACLILADKNLHDSPYKNKSWAAHSVHFVLPEINLMERQLLHLLGFNLHVSDDELAQTVMSTYCTVFPKAMSAFGTEGPQLNQQRAVTVNYPLASTSSISALPHEKRAHYQQHSHMTGLPKKHALHQSYQVGGAYETSGMYPPHPSLINNFVTSHVGQTIPTATILLHHPSAQQRECRSRTVSSN